MTGIEITEGILGIRNRTENWMTARYFSPFFGNAALKLAGYLDGSVESNQHVRIELYWKGMRDFLDKEDKNLWCDKIVERYRKLFGNLQDCVSASTVGFRPLKKHNYNPSKAEALYRNLYNTEIDIMLESPRELFIGEAKGEMSFGADSRLVLVHQLIRQYVMSKILVDLTGTKKCVVPFVVGGRKNIVRLGLCSIASGCKRITFSHGERLSSGLRETILAY